MADGTIAFASESGRLERWSWIVPPMSGSQTPVCHRYYAVENQTPNFLADDEAAGRALQGGPPAFR